MFGALALYVYINLALAVCGIIALFCAKKRPQTVFVLMSVYCALLGYMAFAAQPSNYIASLALAAAALALIPVALLLRFCSKKTVFFSKIVLCCSCAISLALLF